MQPIRGLDHGGRCCREIARRFERNAREALLSQLRDECRQSFRVVAQGIGGRQKEFVRFHPFDDVRNFHDVHGTDQTVEPKRPADDLGVSEDRQANDIGEPNRVSNLRLGG